MNKRRENPSRAGRGMLVASLLLCLTFGSQVMSARLKSATYDEQGYIARGYAYVKLGDLHIRIGTPILLNALNALPLLSLPSVRLPVDHPSWPGTDFHPIGSQFMWRVNDNADQILFLARVPTMMLTLLLVVFCYRWARELFGPWGGLLTLVLCACDPNLIAHGRLATTDLGSTALLFIATYWLWRLLRRPTWTHVVATGVFFGLAQASKFSALVFGPIFALLFLWRAFVPRSYVFPTFLHRFLIGNRVTQGWWGRVGGLLVTGKLVLVFAFIALWAVYGFEVRPIPGATSWPVPAASHLEQFLDISGRLTGEEGRQAQGFLMGDLYVGGRWQYFIVAFLLKTPIPTLTLLAGAVVLSLRKRIGSDAWVLWLPPLIFFSFSLTSELNLGYRYILPVLPFALVLAGRMGQWLAQGLAQACPVPERCFAKPGRRAEGQRRALLLAASSALVGWSLWSVVAIYPDYLAFFNELAGGPDNGWRFLVDSNIDWGPDLQGLKRWMDDRGVERVKLGYVGEALPPYYGIEFDPLPSFPDRWEHPLHHDLYAADPAPGLYAISVNLIQGRNLADADTYAWFREREPRDKVGYSIFIYDVPHRGEGSAVIGLSDLVPADLDPQDYARLNTNDVHVLWFDEERALVFPAGEDTTFMLVADGVAVHPRLAHMWPWQEGRALSTRDGRSLTLFEGNSRDLLHARVEAVEAYAPAWHMPAVQFAPGDPANHGERLPYPIQFGDQLDLLAYEMGSGSAGEDVLSHGEVLTVVSYWRIRAENDKPLVLFVHLLDRKSTYIAGEDRLDVWYENWRPGDIFVQVLEVAISADIAPEEYQVEIGWYRPDSMQRLPVMRDGHMVADRVLLNPLRITSGDE